jgi:hypothetical protein
MDDFSAEIEGKKPNGKYGRKWEYNIKKYPNEIG